MVYVLNSKHGANFFSLTLSVVMACSLFGAIKKFIYFGAKKRSQLSSILAWNMGVNCDKAKHSFIHDERGKVA